MHIYAFGSICRGEISKSSDVDLLAIVDHYVAELDPATYSIYSYKRIHEIWEEGNPFAWHLYHESKLIFSNDNSDFLESLGRPKTYSKYLADCEKFYILFKEAQNSLKEGGTEIFDLSTIFLSIRNFATCYSLGILNKAEFSRSSSLCLGKESVPISKKEYDILERARILCTRGYGNIISTDEINAATKINHIVEDWMKNLLDKAKQYERI